MMAKDEPCTGMRELAKIAGQSLRGPATSRTTNGCVLVDLDRYLRKVAHIKEKYWHGIRERYEGTKFWNRISYQISYQMSPS
jgi:hypothetical protein